MALGRFSGAGHMVRMSTFDQQGNAHRPKGPGGGQFEGRKNRRPDAGLRQDARESRPLHVVVLDAPDPAGGFDTVVTTPSGRRYLRGGKPWRTDGPAYVGIDGTEEVWNDGELVDVRLVADSDGIPGVMDKAAVDRFLRSLTGRGMRRDLWNEPVPA